MHLDLLSIPQCCVLSFVICLHNAVDHIHVIGVSSPSSLCRVVKYALVDAYESRKGPFRNSSKV